jgi:hypothetical protein
MPPAFKRDRLALPQNPGLSRRYSGRDPWPQDELSALFKAKRPLILGAA